MKKLLCASILVFCFSFAAFSQTGNSPCPEITISGPQGLVNPGEAVSFTANVKSANESLKLEFEWKVSLGMISEGQGTSSITVETTPEMAGSNVTAIVNVKGLNSICNKEASEIAVIEDVIEGDPVDSYGKISLNDERGRFDNFFVTLQNNVGSRGYIYFGIEKSEDLKAVKNRISKLMKHFDFREVSRSLVIVDVCYADENQTSFWIVPDGATFPDYGDCERVEIDLK